MNLTPENVLEEQHRSWLQHPVTIQMLKNLEAHKSEFAKASTSNSGNAEIPDAWFRLNAYGMLTLDSAREWITRTELFVLKSQKNTK